MQNVLFLNKHSGGVNYFQSEKRIIHAKEHAEGRCLFAYLNECITYGPSFGRADLLGRGEVPAAEHDYMTPKNSHLPRAVLSRGLDLWDIMAPNLGDLP